MTSEAGTPNEVRDVIIVGSGPSGYTAAIYAARADLKPLVIAGSVTAGGALMNTTEVENFPGFPTGIMGPDLMENLSEQAARFGAEIRYDDVVSVDLSIDLGAVRTVKTAAVDTKGDADTALDLGGGGRLGLGQGRQIFGPQGIDQFRQAVDLRILAGRGGGALPIDVFIPQFEWIDAKFFGEFIHQHFRGEFRLGRTVGPEGRSPGMIGTDSAAHPPNIGDIVAGTDELSTTQGQQIAELGIGAVIDRPI